MKRVGHGRLRHIVIGLALALAVTVPQLTLRADTSSQNATQAASIQFWNREIAVQRGIVAGATPEERAERAIGRLRGLPLNVRARDLTLIPIKLEGQDGIAVTYNGKVLFFLGTNDLDKEAGEN